MKKSTKKFVLSDETNNLYGFKVLTAGIQLDDFKANPVCLYNHDYSKLLGQWADIQIQGAQLVGVPMFDETDPEAMLYYSKVEQGILKGASIGLTPIKFDEVSQEMQTCTVKEVSLTPVPANKNAIAIYDLSGHKISEADVKTFLLSSNPLYFNIKGKSMIETLSFDYLAENNPNALAEMQLNDPAKFNELLSKKLEAVNLKYGDMLKTPVSKRQSYNFQQQSNPIHNDALKGSFDDLAQRSPEKLAQMRLSDPMAFEKLLAEKVASVRLSNPQLFGV